MPGRALLPEATLLAMGYDRPDLVARRRVLRETLAAFDDAEGRYHRLAQANLARWAAEAPEAEGLVVEVHRGDWGEVTRAATRRFGACHAALNMANAFVPGGAYVEGTAAQEENMFRRTDCHFRVTEDELDARTDRYRPELTRLLSAAGGRVFLDVASPRACIRGSEDRGREDLGYPWLPEDEVFPFYELRAAAQDLRSGRRFDPDDARLRIRAQLDTLRDAGVRHAVLSAFGCGAFRNPAATVARLYREELERQRDAFTHVAFGIFDPGYGPDNHAPFAEAFATFG